MLKRMLAVITGLLAVHAAATAGSYGTQLEYSFSTGSGSYAYDQSGNSNIGTIYNATWNANGKIGYALSFDGNGDYVNVPHSSTIAPQQEITVSAWIKCAYSTALRTVVQKGNSYRLYVKFSKVYWRIYKQDGTNQQLVSPITIGDNEWSHVTCTYDGAYLKIYIDGALVTSTAGTGAINYSYDALQIGTYSSAYYFNGLIDELKIFDDALPGEQIERMYVTMLDYTFSTGTGSNVFDESGNLNQGTISGATWTASGKRNNALNFDGSDDVVTVPDASPLNPASEITVSAWVKGDYTYTGNLLHAVLGKSQSYFLSVMNNGKIYWIVSKSGGGSVNTLSNGGIDTDWNHIVCTYDGSVSKIFINGVLDKTLTSAGTINTTINDLQVGLYGSVYPFYGTIDEVKIYNQALSSDQVSRLFISESDAPVLDYDFDAGSGSTVNDASAYDNDGTLGAYGPDWTIAGKVNGGLEFNGGAGADNNVVVPNDPSLTPIYELSVSVWVKVYYSMNGKSYDVLEKGNEFCLAVKGGGVDWQVGNRYFDCSHYMDDGNWKHVVCTYNGLESKVYVDGTLRATDSYDGTINLSSSNMPLNIGFFEYHSFSTTYFGQTIWDTPFDGTMDELKIYPKALSSTEVAQLWNNGAGKAAPDEKDAPAVHADAPDGLHIATSPNPFVSDTRFTVTLPASGKTAVRAELGIFTGTGSMVKMLLDGLYNPGETVRASWDGRDGRGNRVEKGAYFYKFVADGKEATGSIIVSD